MMRKNLSIALAMTLFGSASAAHAQGYAAPFGSKGQVTFAAERLFGFHWVSNSITEANGTHHDGDGTTVGIGWAFGQHMQFNHPRLGIDYFVSQDISIGGAIGFFSGNGSPDYDGFIIDPRVGFNVPISQIVSFWPKLGLEYISVGDNHAFGMSAEANFLFFPRATASWAFVVAPTLDLAPFGGSDRDGPEPNATYRTYSFGVSAGLLGVI